MQSLVLGFWDCAGQSPLQQANKGCVFVNAKPKKQSWERTLILKGDSTAVCRYSDRLTARRFRVWIPWGPGYIMCRGCMFSPCLNSVWFQSKDMHFRSVRIGIYVSTLYHVCSPYECARHGLIWLKFLGGPSKSNTSPCTVLHVLKIMKRALQKNCECTYLCIWIREF